jgi:hypothetical protein
MEHLESKTSEQLKGYLKLRQDIIKQGGLSKQRKKFIEREIDQINTELLRRHK